MQQIQSTQYLAAKCDNGFRARDIFALDPLSDPRWDNLLDQHSSASVFHSRPWLQALQKTYQYLPVAYSTCPPTGELENAWVFCEVRSWLTGTRLVSLPFSDHCDPLGQSPADLHDIALYLDRKRQESEWDYVEFRPSQNPPYSFPGFELRRSFHIYALDLSPSLEQIFAGFAKDSIQRKIRRAERDGLQCEEGRNESLIDRFYSLLVKTRQRHGLPPQPPKWFSNLVTMFGNDVKIFVASMDGRPVGAIFTLRFKQTLVYKYACGEIDYFRHGPMQLLLWRAIQEAKTNGLERLDFGRSDDEEKGLQLYKSRWAATGLESGYYRAGAVHSHGKKLSFATQRVGRPLVASLPPSLLRIAGQLMYRHFG